MYVHRNTCQFNYGTSEEAYELETIVAVFGKAKRKLFKVKWQGYQEQSWEPGHLLLRDGCSDSIKEFWLKSGINPALDFYRTG